jgi:hypothetical protein
MTKKLGTLEKSLSDKYIIDWTNYVGGNNCAEV